VSGLRKLRIGTAVSAALATMLVGPTVASAGPVEDLVNQVSNGVNQTVDGLLGGGGKKPNGNPETQGGDGGESQYVPPAHGTNPHGQGTIAVLDESLITPDPEGLPYPYEPGGANETLVLGRSRGEQNPDGTYHGHVTILSLLGAEIPGADTDEGETEGGPVGDLNDALDGICEDSGFTLCLEILDVDSETTETGSENSFTLASAGVFVIPGLGAFVDGGSSSGEISEQDGCQTATGESHVAFVETEFLGLEGGSAESTSTACNDGFTSQENESSALVFNDLDLLRIIDPAADCENGVPNTVSISELFFGAICNADDSSTVGGTQLDDPYGVREAFTIFLVDFLNLDGGGGTELLGIPVGIPILFKTTLAAAESFAVAPPEEPPVCPDPNNPDCPEPPVPPPPDGDEPEVEEELTSVTDDGPGRRGGPTARASDDLLPFTGADVGLLALIGAAVMAAGLAGMALSDRRRRVREG
jgi:hypothetical protein